MHYFVEVLAPFFCATTGETAYQIWQEDCKRVDFKVYQYDVSLLGAAGIMLAGYDADSSVSWRKFLADSFILWRLIGGWKYRQYLKDILELAQTLAPADRACHITPADLPTS